MVYIICGNPRKITKEEAVAHKMSYSDNLFVSVLQADSSEAAIKQAASEKNISPEKLRISVSF